MKERLLKNIYIFICLGFLYPGLSACTKPPGKPEGTRVVPATILGPADEPASAPQSIKVQGLFEFSLDTDDSLNLLSNFIVNKVVSQSSSLTQIVGVGDTLKLRLSHIERTGIIDSLEDSTTGFQLILQEKLMMGHEGVIYSVKDIQRLLHSK
ncbi:MAG: hypothetical protein EYC69_14430 [Bacteroidetes bacterium]|nr:MAG: hypothetical protein EYC69_14430 [Bacteroidota bacterium]